MKKIIIFFAVCLLVGSLFSSCKSHKPCPAYSQAETEQAETNV
jgi:hypothetical protein